MGCGFELLFFTTEEDDIIRAAPLKKAGRYPSRTDIVILKFSITPTTLKLKNQYNLNPFLYCSTYFPDYILPFVEPKSWWSLNIEYLTHKNMSTANLVLQLLSGNCDLKCYYCRLIKQTSHSLSPLKTHFSKLFSNHAAGGEGLCFHLFSLRR